MGSNPSGLPRETLTLLYARSTSVSNTDFGEQLASRDF